METLLLMLMCGLTRAFLDANSFVIVVFVNNIIIVTDGSPSVIIVNFVIVSSLVIIIVIIVIATDPTISPARRQCGHGICNHVAAY